MIGTGVARGTHGRQGWGGFWAGRGAAYSSPWLYCIWVGQEQRLIGGLSLRWIHPRDAQLGWFWVLPCFSPILTALRGHSGGQHGQSRDHGQQGSGRGLHPGVLQAACMVSPPWELGNLVWQEEQCYL